VLKIFSGNSNKPLAKKIAKIFSVDLSPLEITVFSDGEQRIRIKDSVVGQDCVLVQSTSAPVDENYMELFFIIDALKRSGANSITAVIPYLGYQRQDHVFRDGEAVSLEVVIKNLEGLGVSRVITFDLHSIKIPELFSIPVSHLSVLPLFAEKIKEISGQALDDTVLISPDMGGIRRIKILSQMLSDMPYVTIDKNRNLETGEVSADEINGKVLKHAIIVDDMISTGKTIVTAAELLKKNGAEDLVVMATHPVFSKGSSKLLQESIVSKVIVTDSINVPEEKKFKKLEIISIADEMAKEL
jgi:ribose-phosphate pyrophosphokinase